MPKIIDFDALCSDNEPLQIPFKGKTYTVDCFDSTLMSKLQEAAVKCSRDPKKSAHDSHAAQISAVTGIPVEQFADVDFRHLRKMNKLISEEIYRSGEDEATKKP